MTAEEIIDETMTKCLIEFIVDEDFQGARAIANIFDADFDQFMIDHSSEIVFAKLKEK